MPGQSLGDVRRYAVHQVEQTEEGTPILNSFDLVATTNSPRRAEHLAGEFVRCNPGAVCILIDRQTLATDRQRVFRRTGKGREQRVVAEYV
ncbi:MAG TPA: hypothetical protein VM537_27030 [Anaerolineae bacterium]|nr:hypothetical protein [Anaerolineae bacterium]